MGGRCLGRSWEASYRSYFYREYRMMTMMMMIHATWWTFTVRHYAMYLTYTTSLNPHCLPVSILTPILQMRMLSACVNKDWNWWGLTGSDTSTSLARAPYVFAPSEITGAETVHSGERGLRDSGSWWHSWGERDRQKVLPWISNLSTSEKGDSRHSGSHGSAFRGQRVRIKWEMDLSYFFIKMMIIIKIDTHYHKFKAVCCIHLI